MFLYIKMPLLQNNRYPKNIVIIEPLNIIKLMVKTSWNFTIFKKNELQKERKLTLKRVEKFLRRWRGINLEKPKNILQFLKDYEELISTPPGIFDEEYLYYFLKSLINTKDKKIKNKLTEIENLRKELNNKIFSQIDFLKKSEKKNKILKSRLLKNYRNFLENLTLSNSEPHFSQIFRPRKMEILRNGLSDEIKKYREKLFEDKKLGNKILKKYSHLAEEAINENLKLLIQKEGPNNIYKNLLTKEFDPRILKIIKKVISENKEILKEFFNDYQSQKDNLEAFLRSKISFKEAALWVIDGYNQFDKSFKNFIRDSLELGLVDVYLKKNKSLTPRNITVSAFLPPFILLNFEGKFSNLAQIIHEFAHALHTKILKNYNSPLNAHQNAIIRETVALFFEYFILQNLEEKLNNKNQKELLKLYLQRTRFYYLFYNAALLFTEEEIYQIYKKRKRVTIKMINKIFKRNLKILLGEKMAQEISDYRWLLDVSKGMFWHLPYLISALIANIFLNEYRKNSQGFKKKFLKFLTVGASKSSEKIFKEMGYDIYHKNFWMKALKSIY